MGIDTIPFHGEKPCFQEIVINRNVLNYCCSSTLIVFLFLHVNICCGYSLEVPQRGTSNEYPQHTFPWINKKNVDCYLELSCLMNFKGSLTLSLLVATNCLQLITFANSLDPDQAGQNIWPDLDPNCFTVWWYSWKIFFKKLIFKKKKKENIHRWQKSMQNYPTCKELMVEAASYKMGH